MTTVALLGNDVAIRAEIAGFLSAAGYRILEVDSAVGHIELLNEAEMILMTLLARYVGEVVSRKEIARAFEIDWLQFDSRWLDQTVSRLRRRWLKRRGRELPIRTEHGKGYIFTANIELI